MAVPVRFKLGFAESGYTFPLVYMEYADTSVAIVELLVDAYGNATLTGVMLSVDANGHGTLTGATLTLDAEGNAMVA